MSAKKKLKVKIKAKPKRVAPAVVPCPDESSLIACPANDVLTEAEEAMEAVNKRIAWLQSELARARVKKAEIQLQAKKASAASKKTGFIS